MLVILCFGRPRRLLPKIVESLRLIEKAHVRSLRWDLLVSDYGWSGIKEHMT